MNPDLEKAIAAIRAQGGTDADVEAYIRSLGATEVDPATASIRDMNAAGRLARAAARREATSADERALTGGERLGVGVQNALGVASFGLSNLAGDAIDALFSDRTFKANREARAMTNAASPTVDRVASTIYGSLLNPVGRVIRAPQGAGLLARGTATVADDALQGGATAAISNLDDLSPEGLRRARDAGVSGGLLAVPAAAGVRGLAATARGANTLRRMATAANPDVTAFRLRDAIAEADAALYGASGAEARAAGTTREIRDVLQSQTVKPFADMIRRSESHQGANDAEVLMEAYKLMSSAQRKAAKSIEGTPEFLADLELRNRDIGKAKERMLNAADAPSGNLPPPIPSFRPAVQAHAKAEGEYEAFRDTYDAIRRVLGDKAVAGKKITLDSPEALRRAIQQMTPEQATLALEATLGAARGTARLSSNPITLFGVVPSTFRVAHAPSQINPFIALLEKQAGRKPRFFENPVVRERAGLSAARTAGGLLNRNY